MDALDLVLLAMTSGMVVTMTYLAWEWWRAR
jgi:hypothetical protein